MRVKATNAWKGRIRDFLIKFTKVDKKPVVLSEEEKQKKTEVAKRSWFGRLKMK